MKERENCITHVFQRSTLNADGIVGSLSVQGYTAIRDLTEVLIRSCRVEKGGDTGGDDARIDRLYRLIDEDDRTFLGDGVKGVGVVAETSAGGDDDTLIGS